MSSLLQYFLPNELTAWLVAVGLFALGSVAVTWLLALVLARLPIVVRRDEEMKVHFGVALALLLYGCVATVFLIKLAMEYKVQDVSVLYTVPWCVMDAAALLVAASLAHQIQSRASARASEGRS